MGGQVGQKQQINRYRYLIYKVYKNLQEPHFGHVQSVKHVVLLLSLKTKFAHQSKHFEENLLLIHQSQLPLSALFFVFSHSLNDYISENTDKGYR